MQPVTRRICIRKIDYSDLGQRFHHSVISLLAVAYRRIRLICARRANRRERRYHEGTGKAQSMREHYNFSNGIRGKYAGKVDTTDIRRLRSAKPVERSPAASVTNGNRGLDDRCRDLDGEIRHKRGDTLVRTLRKTCGPDFAPGVRSDTRLDTLRKRAGGESLSKLLKKK